MKPPHQAITLQSGQAMALDPRGSAQLFVAEGEVLLQPSAQWMAGRVVFAPFRRVAAPAVLATRGIHSLTAIGAAKVLFEQPASRLETLRAAWNNLSILGPRLRSE